MCNLEFWFLPPVHQTAGGSLGYGLVCTPRASQIQMCCAHYSSRFWLHKALCCFHESLNNLLHRMVSLEKGVPQYSCLSPAASGGWEGHSSLLDSTSTQLESRGEAEELGLWRTKRRKPRRRPKVLSSLLLQDRGQDRPSWGLRWRPPLGLLPFGGRSSEAKDLGKSWGARSLQPHRCQASTRPFFPSFVALFALIWISCSVCFVSWEPIKLWFFFFPPNAALRAINQWVVFR